MIGLWRNNRPSWGRLGVKLGVKMKLPPLPAKWYTYCHYWPTGTATATTGQLVHLLLQLAYWYTYCHYWPTGTPTATTGLLVHLLPPPRGLLSHRYRGQTINLFVPDTQLPTNHCGIDIGTGQKTQSMEAVVCDPQRRGKRLNPTATSHAAFGPCCTAFHRGGFLGGFLFAVQNSPWAPVCHSHPVTVHCR